VRTHEIDSGDAACILNCTRQFIYKLRRAGKLVPTRWVDGCQSRGGRKPLYDARQVWRLKAAGYGAAVGKKKAKRKRNAVAPPPQAR